MFYNHFSFFFANLHLTDTSFATSNILGSSDLVILVGMGMGGIHLALASQVFLKLGKKCWHPQGWATKAQKVVMSDPKINGDPTPAPPKKTGQLFHSNMS